MFSLLDMGYILFNHSFSKHVKATKNALIGEVQMTVAVMTVLLDGLLLWTLLGNMSDSCSRGGCGLCLIEEDTQLDLHDGGSRASGLLWP